MPISVVSFRSSWWVYWLMVYNLLFPVDRTLVSCYVESIICHHLLWNWFLPKLNHRTLTVPSSQCLHMQFPESMAIQSSFSLVSVRSLNIALQTLFRFSIHFKQKFQLDRHVAVCFVSWRSRVRMNYLPFTTMINMRSMRRGWKRRWVGLPKNENYGWM